MDGVMDARGCFVVRDVCFLNYVGGRALRACGAARGPFCFKTPVFFVMFLG